MMRLVRLLLVNWYRVDMASIDIHGHTAVIGPNASGKSSLLDAIQAVLVGGDKNWWNPNASAGEKSTRSLRDYCLGVVRDPDNPELSAEFRPRDQAITYLALVFRDDEGIATTVGLALHARLSESHETVEGRFIARGQELVLSDLVERTAAGAVPREWKRLREDLRARCPDLLVIPQSGEFQRQLCAVLAGGPRHIDPKRFLRAFRNAITFAPIRNVSDFVRNHILEERPIEVRSLQRALKRYRDIRTRTRDAETREQALESASKLYHVAEQAERQAMSWRWVNAEARFNAIEVQIEPLRETMAARERTLAGLAERAESTQQQWQDADAQLRAAERQLAATDVAQQRKRIEAERDAAQYKLQQTRNRLTDLRRGLGHVRGVLADAAVLGDAELTAALADIAPWLDEPAALLDDDWPANPDALAAAVTALAPRVAQAQLVMAERYEAAVREEGRLKDDLAELKQRLEKLERGESDLSQGTQRLQQLLASHGIDAVPLCDRVDVADETWRKALEAFLGGQREALLVPPAQVREAIAIYRHQGRMMGLHGSRIINTQKTGEWLDRCSKDSLAQVITTDDEHARAYVHRLAGNVLRVDTEAELMKHERAVTADGMLATGGSITRLRPEDPMLGRGARAQRLAGLQSRWEQDGAAFYACQRDKQAIKVLREEHLGPFAQALHDAGALGELCMRAGVHQAEVLRLTEDLNRLGGDGDYARLEATVKRLQAERDTLESGRRDIQEQRATLDRLQAADGSRSEQLEAQSQLIGGQRRVLEQMPGFDAQQATDHLNELADSERFADQDEPAWSALAIEAEQRASSQNSRCTNSRSKALGLVREYLARWPSETAPVEDSEHDHLPMAAWVVRSLNELRESQLAQYVKEAENALGEAEHAFRADFVGKLQENLVHLEEQRKELNRNLRSRPFHGQYYHFTRAPERDLKAVLDWVESWTPEQGGDVGGLFDAAADPAHPHREAIARIKSLLMDFGEEGGEWDERLADYRRYYHFDVKMTDDAEGGGNPEYLSRRLGKGSGGEHQSPFYVAIGAALASAYRIDRDNDGRQRGGMSLAVFDEAFSKLDLQNTVSALGFLDELGLQVILAAPDEKYGQIAEHVDTIVNVYRDGGTVYIDTETIKPAAHEWLAADNPVRATATGVEG